MPRRVCISLLAGMRQSFYVVIETAIAKARSTVRPILENFAVRHSYELRGMQMKRPVCGWITGYLDLVPWLKSFLVPDGIPEHHGGSSHFDGPGLDFAFGVLHIEAKYRM